MRLLDAGLPFDKIGRLGVAQLEGWIETACAFKIERQIEFYQAVRAAIVGKGATSFINGLYNQKSMLLGNNPYAPTEEAIAATKRKLRRIAEENEQHANLQIVK